VLTPITLLMGGTLTLLIRYLVRADVASEARRIALAVCGQHRRRRGGMFPHRLLISPRLGLLRTQCSRSR
jgi:hypothetical protein